MDVRQGRTVPRSQPGRDLDAARGPADPRRAPARRRRRRLDRPERPGPDPGRGHRPVGPELRGSLVRTVTLARKYEPAQACTGAPEPGAKALMAWALATYGKQGLKNLGIYNCRTVRGGSTTSLHGE